MKTRNTIVLAFLLATLTTWAQTAEDALRYSRIYYGGTARFNGLGGAFGAVGADFSTLATNPAGLGLYRGSEMTLTIAPHIGYSSTTYNGSSANDGRVNFGMGNFGVVFSINTSNQYKSGILKSINIGFGFNRQNDFNNRVVIHGINTENSLRQSYVNILNDDQTSPDYVQDDYPFDIGLAYGTNLVFYNSATKRYDCDPVNSGIFQDKTINTHGSINEMEFAFAANLADKVYVGFTLGVPTINYYENSYYKETSIDDTSNFILMKYDYLLHTRGTGVNVKLGMIYKPTTWFRIGASIHSPTWYPSMRDQWSSSMQSFFNDSTNWNQTMYSPDGYYDYCLRTPFRAMGSLAFIIGQYGLISADYEYVDYSQARFNSSQDNYSTVNNDIKTSFRSWGNIRIGTEWRIQDFRLRGGFAYFSNPYVGNNNNSPRYQVSGGFGYRTGNFFTDVTYVWSKMQQAYYLYDATMVNPAEISIYNHTISTSIGFRF